MQEHPRWPLMFEPVQDVIFPFGRQMSSTLTYLVCHFIDIACCMRKVENAQRIVAMALHKPLDPLRPILDGAYLLGSLDTASAEFRARLIRKGGGVGHACKVRDLRCDDLFFAFPL